MHFLPQFYSRAITLIRNGRSRYNRDTSVHPKFLHKIYDRSQPTSLLVSSVVTLDTIPYHVTIDNNFRLNLLCLNLNSFNVVSNSENFKKHLSKVAASVVKIMKSAVNKFHPDIFSFPTNHDNLKDVYTLIARRLHRRYTFYEMTAIHDSYYFYCYKISLFYRNHPRCLVVIDRIVHHCLYQVHCFIKYILAD